MTIVRHATRILLGSLAALGAALTALPFSPAHAQASRVEQVTTYAGPDRDKRLIEGARQEGELTVYSSLPVEDNTALIEAFEKKYGIKVKVWRGSSEDIVRRTLAEIKGRRFDVDVIVNNGLGLEPLHREKVLQAVKSPYLADLIPQAIPPHGEWVAKYLNVFVQAYNTNQVKKEELPKTYRDLLKPEWKGKLGIEAEDYDWLATLVPELGGEAEGLKLFRDIVATNGISVRRGHTLLTNLAVAGEVPFALTVYSFTAEQLKRKGAPIDWFILGPAIARPNGVGVTRTAQHPNAAVLFFDFLISDGQKIFAERNFVPTSKKFDSPFKSSLKVVDTARMLDEGKPWQEHFERIFVKQAR
jgi:iron(III) transport system substrate-binding protein